MYVVLLWETEKDVTLALCEDGSVRVFETYEEARGFVEEEILGLFNYKIVSLRGW